MAIVVKEEKKDNTAFLPSEENHLAVCIGVWDVGKLKSEYQGEVKIKHKVLFRFEVDEDIEVEGEYQGKKKCISKSYNLSLHEKSTLRKDLEAWNGKYTDEQIKEGVDLEDYIGKACMLNIIHNKSNDGRVYANISGITKPHKTMKVFTPDNIYKDEIPEFVQKAIDRNKESLDDKGGEDIDID